MKEVIARDWHIKAVEVQHRRDGDDRPESAVDA
jgi:hypothetical protein